MGVEITVLIGSVMSVDVVAGMVGKKTGVSSACSGACIDLQDVRKINIRRLFVILRRWVIYLSDFI